MKHDKIRRMHGERGASLILAIAFMVVVGAISAAVMSTTSSGLQDRVALDRARNSEYAADGAIETMITAARGAGGVCPTQPTTPPTSPFSLNSINIHVDCNLATGVILSGGVLRTQKNLAFAACPDISGQPCTAATTIITAQVNFRGAAPSTSFVQAWSVNR